jgi:hypothetical protein
MKTNLIKHLRKLQRTEAALAKAKEIRNAARVDLTVAIYDAMKANKLRRSHILKKLQGWSSDKVGNIIHLHQGLRTEAEWLQLIDAVSSK